MPVMGVPVEPFKPPIMKPKIVCLLLFVCLVGMSWGMNPHLVEAHGSGVAKLVEAPAGPYLVTVWLSPTEVRAGDTIHVSVGVQLASDSGGEPVLDADIQLQVVARGASEPVLSTRATTEQSVNKLLYESDMSLTEPGSYTIDVWVDGAAGQGKTSIDIDLQPAAAGGNRRRITAIALGLLAIIFFTGSQLRKRTLVVNESRDISVTSR